MIVTNNDYLADKIRSLRSHGWTRDMNDAQNSMRKFLQQLIQDSYL